MVKTARLKFSTKGDCDIVDITDEIARELTKTRLREGTATVFVIGSTAAVTTCEYEPGLVSDIKDMFQALIPKNKPYKHNDTWQDGNGHSHLRASLLGASVSIPFTEAKLLLGTWQQVIFIDFDNRPRKREVILQFIQ